MTRLLPRVTAAVTALLLVLAAGVVVQRLTHPQLHLTAHFSRAVGVYKGSDVRVLGVKVGKITGVHPEGQTVRVDLAVNAATKIPAAAIAVVVPPSVVSDRYVQLAPVYRSGPVMRDGAEIPRTRTATPVELDEIYQSLNDLDVALGPKGANQTGALSRLLKVGADNLDGQGAQLHTTLDNLSRAVQTLSNGRGDLFSTVRNLQQFTTALAQSDGQVRQFNTDLADVSEQLSGERDELAAALHNLSIALGQVAQFVQQNKGALKTDVAGLADVTGVLVKQRAALADFLDDAPLALSNLNLAYNPISGTLDTRTNFPTYLLTCELLNQFLGQVPAPVRAQLAKLPGLAVVARGGKIPCSDLKLGTLVSIVDVLKGTLTSLPGALVDRLGGGVAPTVPAPALPPAPAAVSSVGGTIDKTLGGILGGGGP